MLIENHYLQFIGRNITIVSPGPHYLKQHIYNY